MRKKSIEQGKSISILFIKLAVLAVASFADGVSDSGGEKLVGRRRKPMKHLYPPCPLLVTLQQPCEDGGRAGCGPSISFLADPRGVRGRWWDLGWDE